MNSLCSRVPMIILAGASLLLGACAEQREIVAPVLPASAAVAGSAVSLPGATYVMTLGPGDFPPFFPPEIVDLLSGDWQLDLTDPRTYVTRLNGDAVVVGRYTANPARLVMHDQTGPLTCPAESGLAHAVYAWSLDGEELSLASVQDRCEGREFVLTVKPWQKQ
jgi:hypothetical protein